ncbi:MAG: hypothetical protein Q7S31_03600 [bacterium]|nr:hypothetical protein [bacterium]
MSVGTELKECLGNSSVLVVAEPGYTQERIAGQLREGGIVARDVNLAGLSGTRLEEIVSGSVVGGMILAVGKLEGHDEIVEQMMEIGRDLYVPVVVSSYLGEDFETTRSLLLRAQDMGAIIDVGRSEEAPFDLARLVLALNKVN